MMSDKIGIAPLQLREEPQNSDLTTRSLCIRSATINEATRSIEATMATETPVMVMDWRTYEPIDEVLVMRGGKMPAQLPLLESHNRYTLDAVLGSVRELRIDSDKAIGRLYFASDDERIDKVWNKVKQRHITDVSVGYRVLSYVDIPAGQTQEVNGRSYTAGKRRLRIATEWEAKELSVVAIGADHNSKTRQATDGQPPSTEALQVNDQLRAFLESLGLRKDATLAEAWTFYHARQGAERARADELLGTSVPPAATPPVTPPTDGQRGAVVPPVNNPAPQQPTAEQIRRQERERCDRIRQLGDEEGDRTTVERAISEDWTVERAAEAILQGRRDRRGSGSGAGVPQGAPAGHVQHTTNDLRRQALAAGLMLRNGCRLDHPAFNDPHAQIALRNHGGDFLALEINDSLRQQAMDYAHRYARMSAVDIARHCIELDGRTVPSGSNWEMIIRSAISGGSFSNVFSTDINARLIAAYREKGDTTRGWVAEEDVNDYRNQERPRMEQGVTLTKHPSGAKADHVSGSDDVEEYKIFRFSGQFVLDEIDWINDNLRALQEKPNQMAAAARRLRPDLVYYILLANPTMGDGVALYHTDRGNYNASLALSSANMKTAIAAFETQQENGINLDLKASHLIVGAKNKHPGLQLVSSQEVRANQNAATEAGTRNTLQDENLTLVSDSRIDNGVTDPNSGTTVAGAEDDWMLMDAMNPAIIVGYLAGTGRSPVLVPWRKNGEDGQFIAGWTVKHSIGAKAIRALSTFKAEG